jgi:hypothetical protein
MNANFEVGLYGDDEMQNGDFVLVGVESRAKDIDGYPLLIYMPDYDAHNFFI